jgi:hypothetical protein
VPPPSHQLWSVPTEALSCYGGLDKTNAGKPQSRALPARAERSRGIERHLDRPGAETGPERAETLRQSGKIANMRAGEVARIGVREPTKSKAVPWNSLTVLGGS